MGVLFYRVSVCRYIDISFLFIIDLLVFLKIIRGSFKSKDMFESRKFKIVVDSICMLLVLFLRIKSF